MTIFNLLLGLLIPIYVFMLVISIAAYRSSGDRRILASSLIFSALLIKSVLAIYKTMSGEPFSQLFLLIDSVGIMLVIMLWKWR